MNKYLIVILFLALFLRVHNLEGVPPEINIDEASVGYNAYAILTTGADEHGEPFPLFFKAFGEFKDPVIIYSAVPIIGIFGLSPFSVRLTAVIWGMLAILALYFLTKRLFDEKTALLATFFLAVAPWHIQISRISTQLVTFPALFLFGVYLFLKEKRHLSAIVLAISCYSYGIARLFVPLFVFVLLWKNKMKNQERIKFLFIFFLIISPLFYLSFFGPANTRFEDTSIFSDKQPVQLFLNQYLNYFNPFFYFISGDQVNLFNNVHGFGLLHILQFPLILIGLYVLYKKRNWLLAAWLFLGPLPAALTRDIMSMRIVPLTGLFAILSSIGTINLIKKYKSKFILVSVIGLLMISTVTYSQEYFSNYPNYSGEYWQDGFNEVFNYAVENKGEYDIIYFSPKIVQPEILIRFYDKTPPKDRIPFEICSITKCFNKTSNDLFILPYYEAPNIPEENLKFYRLVKTSDINEKLPTYSHASSVP